MYMLFKNTYSLYHSLHPNVRASNNFQWNILLQNGQRDGLNEIKVQCKYGYRSELTGVQD